MKVPGPDHPITVTDAPERWRVRYANHVIADSADALLLKEADYPPVVYFPREDVSMEYLARTDHHTHCPYKGEASYFTLEVGGERFENAAWSYESPRDEVTEIKGFIAFYDSVVEIAED